MSNEEIDTDENESARPSLRVRTTVLAQECESFPQHDEHSQRRSAAPPARL